MVCAWMLAVVLAQAPGAAASEAARAGSLTARAEALAAEATRMAPSDAAGALERARRALALTVEFEPTAFVAAGRKGEVVEDAYQSARASYRQHRAILYEAAGRAHGHAGQSGPASRYLQRAFLLAPNPERALALARAWNALGRGRHALDVIRRGIPGLSPLSAEAVEVIARSADVLGLPSAQTEIDRGRLLATLGTRVVLREGPLEVPAGARLSSAPVARFDDAPLTVVYAAEESCRSCSADLDALARLLPKVARVWVAAEEERDLAPRQVLALYRRPWSVLVGRGIAGALGLAPRSLLLVARRGWTVASVAGPHGPETGAAASLLLREDLQETAPRPAWNRRAADRSPLPGQPGLLPDDIVPGEDEPFPPEFVAAVADFRAGRFKEALAAFSALEAKGDGWLLSPEARLDRALCLAGLQRREEARRLLLRTGDSRFEEATDRLLERLAAAR